jgi:hypothetical protein
MRRSRAPNLRQLMAEAVRIAGSQGALGQVAAASFVSVHPREGDFPRDAIAIHRIIGGRVPASLLRPDLWCRPEHVPVDKPAP